MANFFPLIVDSVAASIKELPSGDDLNLANSNIINAVSITSGSFTGNGRPLTSLNAANIDTGTLPAARLSGTYTITVSGAATTAGTVTTAAQPNITSVGTLSALAVTGNITGGNLITAGLASVSSITKTGTNAVGDIGQTTNRFNNVFARASSASYADLAEIYLTDGEYPAGTVVIFGGTKEVTVSEQYADSRLAGVISTDPAFLMNDGSSGQPIALQGRVPCSVVGNIVKGDLITTSTIPGVATRLEPADWKPGTVLGKALENYNSDEPGVIQVVVGRV
jgi:trimeric autotransporter adhesin